MPSQNQPTAAAQNAIQSPSFIGEDKILGCISVPQRALLRTLATSLERRLDTASMVVSLAQEFTGTPAERLVQLSNRLSMQVPLVEAIRQTPGVLDPSIVVALELSAQEGRVVEFCRELVESSTQWDQTTPIALSGGLRDLVRSGLGILFATFILSFLVIFILPTFEKMFDEFGLTTPLLFRWLVSLHSIMPFVLGGAILVVISVITFNAVAVIHGLKSRFDPLAWQTVWIPDQTKLLSLLSLVTRSEQATATGLETLGRLHPNESLRVRLKSASQRIAQGQETFGALHAEKLLSSRESQSLVLTDSPRAHTWMLRQFATKRWERTRGRRYCVARIGSILATSLLGLIVTWAAIAVLMTLFSLVSGLA